MSKNRWWAVLVVLLMPVDYLWVLGTEGWKFFVYGIRCTFGGAAYEMRQHVRIAKELWRA